MRQRRNSKICTDFYKSLYTQIVPAPESTMKSSLDTEETPEFTEEEVERAIKRMKRHKAQGMDGITSDVIKLGGWGGGCGGLPINRGVRQVDPLSPKPFTTVMEEVIKKADISEGINVD